MMGRQGWRLRTLSVVLPVLLALVAIAPDSTVAARIAQYQSKHCNIRLTGEIEPGDARKLQEAIESAAMSGDDAQLGEAKAVCLDSTDGSFAEALEIIKLFGGSDTLGTVVEQNAACIGPCALVFMAGRFHAFHGITFPLRKMHVGGTLGFRTLSPSQTNRQDRKAIASAFASAVRQVAQILKQNVESQDLLDRNRPYPRSLSAEVLSLPPGETLFVETLDQANLWQITLLGLPPPRVITTAMLWTACDNYDRGHGIKSANPHRQKRPPDGIPVPLVHRVHRVTFKGFGEKGGWHCVADVYDQPRLGPVLQIANQASLEPRPGEFVSTPQSTQEFFDEGAGDFGAVGIVGDPMWLMFPGSTRIKDVAALLEK